jgi:hypothetical protein
MGASYISQLFDEGLSLKNKMCIKHEEKQNQKLNYISQEN